MKKINILGILSFICFIGLSYIVYIELTREPSVENKQTINYQPYFDGVDYAIKYLNDNKLVKKNTPIDISISDFMQNFINRDSSSYEKQFIDGFYFTVHYYINNNYLIKNNININFNDFYNHIDSCKNYNSLNL